MDTDKLSENIFTVAEKAYGVILTDYQRESLLSIIQTEMKFVYQQGKLDHDYPKRIRRETS